MVLLCFLMIFFVIVKLRLFLLDVLFFVFINGLNIVLFIDLLIFVLLLLIFKIIVFFFW